MEATGLKGFLLAEWYSITPSVEEQEKAPGLWMDNPPISQGYLRATCSGYGRCEQQEGIADLKHHQSNANTLSPADCLKP